MSSPTALIPFLVRGFLRLLTAAAPLAVIFTALAFDQRILSWEDRHSWSDAGQADDLSFGTPRSGTDIVVNGHPTFTVQHGSTGLWLLWHLPDLVVALAITVVAFLLLRMLADTYGGEPFTDAAPRRLNLVAFTITVTAVIAPLLRAVAVRALVDRVQPDQTPDLLGAWDIVGHTVPWLVAAGLVAVVAEAFRVGNRLTHDVDGLV